MSDEMPDRDPRFPDRPQHPDFLLLAEKARTLDGMAGACTPGGEDDFASFNEMLAKFSDPASTDYVAEQRSTFLLQGVPVSIPPQVYPFILAAVETAWTDGFYIGNMFSGAKASEEITIPDTLEGL